jgi:hypothetical protein
VHSRYFGDVRVANIFNLVVVLSYVVSCVNFVVVEILYTQSVQTPKNDPEDRRNLDR